MGATMFFALSVFASAQAASPVVITTSCNLKDQSKCGVVPKESKYLTCSFIKKINTDLKSVKTEAALKTFIKQNLVGAYYILDLITSDGKINSSQSHKSLKLSYKIVNGYYTPQIRHDFGLIFFDRMGTTQKPTYQAKMDCYR